MLHSRIISFSVCVLCRLISPSGRYQGGGPVRVALPLATLLVVVRVLEVEAGSPRGIRKLQRTSQSSQPCVCIHESETKRASNEQKDFGPFRTFNEEYTKDDTTI